jgi:3-hydroxyisobutyrate dehydrogenase-like beta-hydroxyacid dehydrogenase
VRAGVPIVRTMPAFIGFGEAGTAFATAPDWAGEVRAFDVDPARTLAASLVDALRGADAVLSVVTADAALKVAREAAPLLGTGALFLDMNSVAPDTKRAARDAIEGASGRYVDVAVMAPVHPARLAVPLLVSGDHAEAGAAALRAMGFSDVCIVAGGVGTASAIKMIRSVMIKGVEALTAEMMAAADAAGVGAQVLASLGDGWDAKAAYNLERMTTHGMRRAAEMEEVAKTLTALGVDPLMTRGTIVRQREMAGQQLRKAA